MVARVVNCQLLLVLVKIVIKSGPWPLIYFRISRTLFNHLEVWRWCTIGSLTGLLGWAATTTTYRFRHMINDTWLVALLPGCVLSLHDTIQLFHVFSQTLKLGNSLTFSQIVRMMLKISQQHELSCLLLGGVPKTQYESSASGCVS